MFFLACCNSVLRSQFSVLKGHVFAFVGMAHIERHPGDRFIFRYGCPLDQPQRQSLIVELDGEYSTWRGPSPNHEMVFHFATMMRGKGPWMSELKQAVDRQG